MGATIKCNVRVGKSLIPNKVDRTLCRNKIKKWGCSSVKGVPGKSVQSIEYCVYDYRKVDVLDVLYWHP